MRKTNKNTFIEGFKDITPISSLNEILLVDIKGDGDNKLILFNKDNNTILVYKGIYKSI